VFLALVPKIVCSPQQKAKCHSIAWASLAVIPSSSRGEDSDRGPLGWRYFAEWPRCINYQHSWIVSEPLLWLITHKCPSTSLVSRDTVSFSENTWRQLISSYSRSPSIKLSLVTGTCAAGRASVVTAGKSTDDNAVFYTCYGPVSVRPSVTSRSSIKPDKRTTNAAR